VSRITIARQTSLRGQPLRTRLTALVQAMAAHPPYSTVRMTQSWAGPRLNLAAAPHMAGTITVAESSGGSTVTVNLDLQSSIAEMYAAQVREDLAGVAEQPPAANGASPTADAASQPAATDPAPTATNPFAAIVTAVGGIVSTITNAVTGGSTPPTDPSPAPTGQGTGKTYGAPDPNYQKTAYEGAPIPWGWVAGGVVAVSGVLYWAAQRTT